MAWTGPTRNARRSIRTVSRYRSAAAAAAVVRRRSAPTVQSIRVRRWVRSVLDVRQIRTVVAARPAVLSQSVCRVGDRLHVKRKRCWNNRRRSSPFVRTIPFCNRRGCFMSGHSLCAVPSCSFGWIRAANESDKSPRCVSWRTYPWRWRVSMIAGKASAVWLASRRQNKKPKETLSSMIRNQKPPAVHQQVLFSTVVQQVVDLPTDKQREVQTAVAELLLNALTGDDSIDSGQTDDTSQTHA